MKLYLDYKGHSESHITAGSARTSDTSDELFPSHDHNWMQLTKLKTQVRNLMEEVVSHTVTMKSINDGKIWGLRWKQGVLGKKRCVSKVEIQN